MFKDQLFHDQLSQIWVSYLLESYNIEGQYFLSKDHISCYLPAIHHTEVRKIGTNFD